mgnify:CR=1 FL=1
MLEEFSAHKDVNIYLGLGSNLDDPISQVLRALDELRTLRRSSFICHSSLYLNPPIGARDQPDYINAAARLRTCLTPLELLDELLKIERTHHRLRSGQRWGPRTLDLDILLYSDRQIDEARLAVPHPGLHQRAFVLIPLYEIQPDLHIPGYGALPNLISQCPGRDDLIRIQTQPRKGLP